MPTIKLHPKKYSDADYVRGVAEDNKNIKSSLYKEWYEYFENKNYNLFFNISKEDKEDVRHDAFFILSQKIRLGAIRAEGDTAMGRDGNPLKCSLMTYLMSIAVNLKRELVRKGEKLKYWDDVFASTEVQTAMLSSGEFLYSPEEQVMHEIIAKCLTDLPKRCYEILSMFYYEERSLDEILEIYAADDQGIKSKDALKTRKNKCMNTLREMANTQYEKYINS